MAGYIGTEQIKRIHENMEELKRKIAEYNIDQSEENCPTLAVLIGGTGSGKSTFMHILANKKLIVQEDAYETKILESQTPWKEFTIGHKNESQTEIPGLWFDRARNIIFCDCPGFFDTNGSAQDIVNIFSIVTLLNLIKKVKIILMISEDDCESLRGQYSIKQFDIVNKISEVKSSEKGICMIITQANKKLRDKEKLNGFLSGIGGVDDENDDEKTEEEKEEIIINIAKEADKRIFILENLDDLEVNSEYDKFTNEDMEHFMEFINDKNDYYKPKNKVPLNESALLFILSVINSLDRMNSIIHDFAKIMIKDYEQEIEETPEELDKWKNIIINLKNQEYEKLDDFVTSLKEQFNKEEYQDIYKKIEHIQFLLTIFNRINFDELKRSESQACKNFMKSVSGESISMNFHKELQVIENEITKEEKTREAERERQQEYKKRLEAEEAKLRAENRADEIEKEKKKIMEEINIKEEKIKKQEQNRKQQEAKKKELEDSQKQLAANRQKSQDEIQLLQKQVEALKNEKAQPIHVHCSGSGPCNIF